MLVRCYKNKFIIIKKLDKIFYTMINPTQLRAFHAVATHGSFSGAAAQVGLTQPAITIQVRNLEKIYGLILFERSGDGAKLTPTGTELFHLTGDMFDIYDRIDGYLAAARDVQTGTIRLAADSPHLATKIITAFHAEFPGVHVTLGLGNAPLVWNDLAEGRADAVIAADAPNDPVNHIVPLRDGRLVVIVGADHPWAAQDQVGIRTLNGQTTVLRERRSNTRRMVDRLTRQYGVALDTRLELDSREAVVEAVAAGLGIGFIFDSEVTPDRRVNAVRLDGVDARNQEVAACLQARRRHNMVRAFMETAAEWAKSAD